MARTCHQDKSRGVAIEEAHTSTSTQYSADKYATNYLHLSKSLPSHPQWTSSVTPGHDSSIASLLSYCDKTTRITKEFLSPKSSIRVNVEELSTSKCDPEEVPGNRRTGSTNGASASK